MLCSHKKRFIYIKTRKTAGTSVELLFQRFCLPEGFARAPGEKISATGIVGARGTTEQGSSFHNHMTAREICEKLGTDAFNSYFKFCVIRNPFDKVVSHFWFSIGRNSLLRRVSSMVPFSILKIVFLLYVRRHSGSLNDRSIFMIDGRPAVDEFIRFEHLAHDLGAVCKTLDIEFRSEHLGHFVGNFRQRKEHFSEYYNAYTERLIQKEFGWELDRFGYALPPSRRKPAVTLVDLAVLPFVLDWATALDCVGAWI